MLRLIHLSGRRRALLIEAVLRMWAARLTLTLLPFRMWRARLARMMQPPPPPVNEIAAQDALAWWKDAAWAIRAARRVVPDATCLVQAMAGHDMGAARGERRTYTPRLIIGVAALPNSGKNGGQNGGSPPGLDAHAWLEYDNVVILGGHVDVRRYARLPQFPAERAGASMTFR